MKLVSKEKYEYWGGNYNMGCVLKKWSTDLLDFGWNTYSLGEYGITPEEFENIKLLVGKDRVDYKLGTAGDTEESLKLELFRLKHPQMNDEYIKPCLKKLDSDQFNAFIAHETHMTNFLIDRVQSHIYRPSGFIAKHIDAESDEYLYTFIIILQAAEEGGEFVLYFDDLEYVIKPQAGTLVVLDSRIPHEVRPVKKGNRKTLCGFIRAT